MRSGRMRRVDEAMRAVLSDAIAKDLKDPRVGFVTVTGVKTSPDLRHARVYVSVLGDEPRAQREHGRAAVRPRVPPAPPGHRADAQAHAVADLRIRRFRRPRDAHLDACWPSHEPEEPTGDQLTATAPPATGCCRAARRRQAGRRGPREPGRRRHRLAGGDARHPRRDRQGLPHVHRRARPAAASGVPLPAARRARVRAARRRQRAHDRVPGLRQHRAQPGRGVPRKPGRIHRTSSTSTTTTTTPTSGPSTSWCPRPPAPPRSCGT